MELPKLRPPYVQWLKAMNLLWKIQMKNRSNRLACGFSPATPPYSILNVFDGNLLKVTNKTIQ